MIASSRWALMVVGEDGEAQIVVERDRMVITPTAELQGTCGVVKSRAVILRGDAAVALVLAVEGCRASPAAVVGVGAWRCSAWRYEAEVRSTEVPELAPVRLTSAQVLAVDHLITSARVVDPLIVEGSEPELLLRLREVLSAGGER